MSSRISLAACLLLFTPAVFAQIEQPGQLPGDPGSPANSQANSEPLTVGEKYKLALKRTVDPLEWARIALGASLDQAFDYPSNWGQGWDAFGVRMASGFGQHAVREQLEFGVWALDHEDPRHRRSGLHGVWPRTKYAIVHTFVAWRDDGGEMPAYSRFIGDYGAGFVSREWYPTRFHHLQEGIDAGSLSLGLDAGMNVAREFMPHWLVH
ncbi:MAG TPA: hypothetical protein VME17_10705 [Bryobacteraceae bacterium]|nr:hypothetical protein [Bryobacteraceae bacterium]